LYYSKITSFHIVSTQTKESLIKEGVRAEIINKQFKSGIDFNKTLSDKTAIFIINILGSINFFPLAVCFFFWIIWNLNFFSFRKVFDPFPFPALQMIVSIFAIILSVSVLISQKRQGRFEKISQQIEFEVNVKAESEITKMLEMLHNIQKKIGIDNKDIELEKMKENLDIQDLHQKLDENF
jgi:uncharacterized membrane protein